MPRAATSAGGGVPEEELDRLYGLPLEEFTAARNALAAELRREDREASDAVRRLRKPSRAAWIVNQLARRRGAAVRSAVEAGRELRLAHEGALARGDAGPLRAAAERERAAVERVVQEAASLIGAPASGGARVLDRVRSTLHAAAGDEDLSEQILSGRVVEDREPVGLGPLAAPSAAAVAEERGARERERQRRLRLERGRRDRARAQLERAEGALARARDEAERIAAELRAREREVEEARTAVEEAERAVGESD